MRKIILILAAFTIGLTEIMAQSVELTPSGYEGKQTTSDNIVIKTIGVPVLNMYRHGGSIASPSATAANFTIGRVWGGGHTGADFLEGAARLDFRTTTNVWSKTNTGAFMRFYTTPDGTTTASEQMRLTDDGKLGVGLTNPGTTFEVSSATGENGINISKAGSGFGSARLSFWTERNTGNEWRPGYIESGDNGSYTGRIDFYTNGTGSLAKLGTTRGMSLVDKALIVGNSAFGVFEPQYQLHVVSTTNGLNSPLTGTGGMFGIGNTNGGHMGMTTGAIDTWFNTSGSTLNLNFYSKGAVRIGSTGQGNLEVEGYTQMGDDFNAPKIKMNTFYGSTTGATFVNITHNIPDANKILSVDALILSTTNAHYYPPNGVSSVFHQYSYRISSSQVKLEDIGSSLQNSTYKVTITYED